MKSLKKILFFRYAVAVTVVVIILAVVLIFPLRSQVTNAEKEHLEIEAVNLAALLKPYFRESHSEDVVALLETVAFSREERVTVIDAAGTVLGDNRADADRMENHAGRPEMRGALDGEVTVATRRSGTLGEDYLYAAAPITIGGQVVGAARVSIEPGSLTPAILETWLIMVGSLAFLLLLLFGITFWTQKTLTSDLEVIGDAMGMVVVDNSLDRMPQPELEDLRPFARDLDIIAGRVRENYQQLEREKDRLGAILENINTGIIVLGMDGKIDLINPMAKSILGVDEEEALGKAFVEIHHTVAIDRAIEKAREGKSMTEEVQILIPSHRTLRVLSSPIINAEGEAAGVICVLEDITSRRRLERMRRDFVANVSHELRTPVANLRAVIDAMLEGAVDDRKMARQFLDSVDRESERLMGIILDLLTLSRLESDEYELSFEPFDMTDMINEVLSEKTDLASKHDISLVFEPESPEIYVEGDRNLIKTACTNLVDNAIKYNRPGGEVTVSTGESDGQVSVLVRDTGQGIPEKEQEKIFERFYRVDKARSRETGGTGLGLSIVKHVTELHQGSVSVESTEGRGSVFALRLPSARNKGSGESPPG